MHDQYQSSCSRGLQEEEGRGKLLLILSRTRRFLPTFARSHQITQLTSDLEEATNELDESKTIIADTKVSLNISHPILAFEADTFPRAFRLSGFRNFNLSSTISASDSQLPSIVRS